MRVYFVISEMLTDLGNGYMEPAESGCIVAIVVSATAHKARWLVWRADRSSRGMAASEMPNFRCYRLGVLDAEPHVMDANEAVPWWEKATEVMTPPPPRDKPRSVVFLGPDPNL